MQHATRHRQAAAQQANEHRMWRESANVVTARKRGERIVCMAAGGAMLETTIAPPKPPPCSPIPPCLPPPHFATPAFCVPATCCCCCYCCYYCCALPYAVVVARQKVCLPASQPCLQKARSAVYCFFGMSTRCSPVGCWWLGCASQSPSIV